MLITAVCPECETSYKVDAALRGKAMRCPNPQCRAVFTVPAEPAPPLPPADNGKRTGLVGDVIPLLPVEGEAAAPSWQSPPPIRRPSNPPSAPPPASPPAPPERAPEPAAPPAKKKAPLEAPAKTWEPPPVRRKPEKQEALNQTPAPIEAAPEAPLVPDYGPPAPRGKRLVWVVAAFAVGVALLLAVGGYLVWTQIIYTEANIAKAADADYALEKYDQAGNAYHGLVVQFPNSARLPYYQLMQDLCEVRSQASSPEPDIVVCLDRFNSFIDDHKEKDADLLKQRAPDLADTVAGLAKSFAMRNTQPTDETPLDAAKRLEDSMKKITELDAAMPSADARLAFDKNIRGVREAVVLNRRIRDAVGRLKKAAETKPASMAVREFFRKLKREQAALPEVAQQPEVSQLRKQVYTRHLEGVRYSPEAGNAAALDHAADSARYPSLLVDPLLHGGLDKPAPDDPVVLAVVRGVLYALNRADGRTKWAVRVGVDTTDLPVRVPAQVGLPERILVVSADAKAVTALDADGVPVWQYALDAECLGRPLIVDQLAYLATYDGKVHEIELAQGKRLGVFDLGQPLTVGGVREPNTSFLYFPGDDFCVYVLDVSARPKKCAAILYTNHAAGSLRSEPLILSAPDAQGADADWLVLNQAEGLHNTRLNAYRLTPTSAVPITDREEPAEKLGLKGLSGWTWFPPYHDGEKMVMLSDAGVLSIFGIRQARNPRDPLLFPMLPEDYNVGPVAPTAPDARNRAEAAEVRDRDYWVLAGGELKRFYLELTSKEGPRMKQAFGWKTAPLGSPLQAAQVEKYPLRMDKDALTDTSLILVTQPAARQTCLATAVDAKDGEIIWQRQLGFVCQGEPLELRPAGANGPAAVVALDRGGGLFAFDPAQKADIKDSEFHKNYTSLYESLDDGPGLPPVLLAGPKDESAYEIACRRKGAELELAIRRVTVNPTGAPPEKDAELSVPIHSPLAGTPIVTENMIVLPLADGVLARLALPLTAESKVEMGPNWSSKKTPQEAVCRLAALGPDDFLASDGGRSLTYWRWKAAKDYISMPRAPTKDPEAPTLIMAEAEGSLTAGPVLLPEVDDKRQVCVTDVSRGVTLISVTEDGNLKPGTRWKLDGQVTAGPFIETAPDGTTRISCVIDSRRLVWLDPAKEKPLWLYQGQSAAALVGRPRLIGGQIIVADDSGRIVGLNPTNGTPIGKGFQLPGSTAPAAGPVEFGAGRLFVPLSDGTVLLPP